MIKRINIYDIDGTIVDSSHRYRINGNGKIDLEHWIQNDKPEIVARDSLLPLAKHYKDALLNPDIYVILATARACIKDDFNYDFIRDNLGLPDMFVHRQGRTDTRGGAHLKIQAIKPLLNLKPFMSACIHVYEDNSDYLRDITHALRGEGREVVGHFNPSYQGH